MWIEPNRKSVVRIYWLNKYWEGMYDDGVFMHFAFCVIYGW